MLIVTPISKSVIVEYYSDSEESGGADGDAANCIGDLVVGSRNDVASKSGDEKDNESE